MTLPVKYSCSYRTFRRCSLVLITIALVFVLYVLTFSPPTPLAQVSDYDNDMLESMSWSPGPPGLYLVESPSCHIPALDADPPSLRKMKLVYQVELPPCAMVPPLSSVRQVTAPAVTNDSSGADAPRWGFVLRISQSLMKKHRPTAAYCCFSVLKRENAEKTIFLTTDFDANVDNHYSVGPCKNISDYEVALNPDVEFVKVRCMAKGKKHAEVYTNMHALPAPKKEVMAKLSEQERVREQENGKEANSDLSVLMIGIDSVSRLNFLRAMPRTASLLSDNGWIDLAGYNKVGDNTLPNLMAILTGKSLNQIRSECFRHQYEPFDNCTILWRNFSRQGYVTAYAEDEPSISSWNFHKAGFRQPPTDYYIRPLMLAATNDLKVTKRDSLTLCLGPSLAAEHVLNYASNIANLLQNHKYFGLFWMNSLSHNNVNTPSALDDPMYRFWRGLLNSDALKKTFVIFLSDHGMRSGNYRVRSPLGWYEERLPFSYVRLPDAFRAANPGVFTALQINANRLTTPWDLYVTLADVLRRASDGRRDYEDPVTLVSQACPGCRSLFSPVQFDRSCDTVNITPHYCTCLEYKDVSFDDPIVKKGVSFVIDSVHSIIAKHQKHVKKGFKCAHYKRHKVLLARKHSRMLGNYPSANNLNASRTVTNYLISIEVMPLHAVFEATVQYVNDQFQIGTEISRLTSYYGHDSCVTLDYLKLYCSCVKL